MSTEHLVAVNTAACVTQHRKALLRKPRLRRVERCACSRKTRENSPLPTEPRAYVNLCAHRRDSFAPHILRLCRVRLWNSWLAVSAGFRLFFFLAFLSLSGYLSGPNQVQLRVMLEGAIFCIIGSCGKSRVLLPFISCLERNNVLYCDNLRCSPMIRRSRTALCRSQGTIWIMRGQNFPQKLGGNFVSWRVRLLVGGWYLGAFESPIWEALFRSCQM